MKVRRATAYLLVLMIALPLAACSVAPHGKTVVLHTPKPTPTAAPASPGKPSFTLEKATMIPEQSFDAAGYFLKPGMQFVYGWLDGDHLAAIGLAPVAAASEPEATHAADALRAAKGIYSPLSVNGLVGQILSVDWQTGKTEEVHTVQNQMITSMGLSHDKSKLWYCSTDAEGGQKLYVSDVSFRHALLEVSDYQGYLPFWSSRDKYLGYLDYEKKQTFLTVFDGVKSRLIPFFLPPAAGSPVFIDDDTDRVLTIFKNVMMMSTLLSDPNESSSGKLPAEVAPEAVQRGIALDYATEPVWTNTGSMLYIGSDGKGSRLEVVDQESMAVTAEYSGVLNFALSDDSKYICLVREAAGGSADISIAEWNDGRIANEKLVFKGFTAGGKMFFSPDDAKLYIHGSYGYASAETTSLVLKFK